jgi:hypothetical protein
VHAKRIDICGTMFPWTSTRSVCLRNMWAAAKMFAFESSESKSIAGPLGGVDRGPPSPREVFRRAVARRSQGLCGPLGLRCRWALHRTGHTTSAIVKDQLRALDRAIPMNYLAAQGPHRIKQTTNTACLKI